MRNSSYYIDKGHMLNKILILLILFSCVSFVSLADQNAQKYPPYPDVWGIDIPVAKSVSYSAIHVVRMPEGDYLIVYIKDKAEVKGKNRFQYEGRLLFSGHVREFSIDEYNEFFSNMRKEKRVLKSSPSIFSDGSKVEMIRDIGPKVSTFEWYMQGKDKSGKVLTRKKLLYLYDKPVKIDIRLAERNFDYKKEYYYGKVDWPSEMIYFRLEDDTFLMVGFLKYQNPPSVVVIRFDQNFGTRSDLLGKKIFLFNEEIYHKYNGPRDDQAVNDFFYNYLRKTRKEN